MFSSLFFLFTVFVLIAFAPESYPLFSMASLSYSLYLYAIVIGAIFLQNKSSSFNRLPSSKRSSLVQMELLVYLAISIYLFGTFQAFSGSPLQMTFFTFYVLVLYFLGLFIHLKLAKEKSFEPLRFITPFPIPYLCLIFLTDIWEHLPHPISLILTIVLLVAIILFFPVIFKWVWKCTPLPKGPIRDGLEALCKKAQFHSRGLYRWSALKRTATAGIIGILPRFRYVLFTNATLEKFSQDEMEAILAHEIAHSKHFHLILYPLIICGFIVFMTLIEGPLDYFLEVAASTISPSIAPLIPLAVFILVAALYFRLVFGFFSRQFERQADLAVFNKWGPTPHAMIQALRHIATYNNIPLEQPNWHHFGIQERIDFLQLAIDHPKVVKEYHRKVKLYLILYFFLLALGLFALLAMG